MPSVRMEVQARVAQVARVARVAQARQVVRGLLEARARRVEPGLRLELVRWVEPGPRLELVRQAARAGRMWAQPARAVVSSMRGWTTAGRLPDREALATRPSLVTTVGVLAGLRAATQEGLQGCSPSSPHSAWPCRAAGAARLEPIRKAPAPANRQSSVLTYPSTLCASSLASERSSCLSNGLGPRFGGGLGYGPSSFLTRPYASKRGNLSRTRDGISRRFSLALARAFLAGHR